MENSLKIIYENEDLMVVDKPSGLTVNRSDTTQNVTTLQDLVEATGKIDKNEDPEFVARAGIVHRLDKETSGALIVAKNAEAFRNLQAQFKERRVEKEYIALAHGEIFPTEGEINVPVGRLPWNRKRFGVLAGGREAVTGYKVEGIGYLGSGEGREALCLVRLFPKTGRTHQIRVHLKYINHPIFADELYGGRKTARTDRKLLLRTFLHAEKITFYDPKTDEKINCESPLPDELKNLLEKVGLTINN